MTKMRWPQVEGFFELTKPCRLSSNSEMVILHSWKDWLEGRGIRTHIETWKGFAVLYRTLVNGQRPGVFPEGRAQNQDPICGI